MLAAGLAAALEDGLQPLEALPHLVLGGLDGHSLPELEDALRLSLAVDRDLRARRTRVEEMRDVEVDRAAAGADRQAAWGLELRDLDPRLDPLAQQAHDLDVSRPDRSGAVGLTVDLFGCGLPFANV